MPIFVSNVRQLFAADDFSRRHFSDAFFLGALRVNYKLLLIVHYTCIIGEILNAMIGLRNLSVFVSRVACFKLHLHCTVSQENK